MPLILRGPLILRLFQYQRQRLGRVAEKPWDGKAKKTKAACKAARALRSPSLSMPRDPIEDRLPEEIRGIGCVEDVDMSDVQSPLGGWQEADDMDRHVPVPSPQESRRVDPEFPEAASGPQIEDRDGDLGQMVGKRYGGLVADDFIAIGDELRRLIRRGAALEVEPGPLRGVDQTGGRALSVEGAGHEMIEGGRLAGRDQVVEGRAEEQGGLKVGQSRESVGRSGRRRQGQVSETGEKPTDRRLEGAGVEQRLVVSKGGAGPQALGRVVGLHVDVDRNEALDLAQPRRHLRLRVEVGVAGLAAAAPAQEVEPVEAVSGRQADAAGDSEGDAHV